MADAPTIINNTKEWYDLADTALKIGLGALIAGGFTYLTTKTNHKYEFSRNKYERKIKILDQATEICEEYFMSAHNLLNILYGEAKKGTTSLDDINEIKIKKAKEIDNIFINNQTKLIHAMAQFSILGLEEINTLIIGYDREVLKLRNLLSISKELPTEESLKKTMSELFDIKKDYTSNIKEYFENLK